MATALDVLTPCRLEVGKCSQIVETGDSTERHTDHPVLVRISL
jgi:hypothetical protein